MTKFQVKRLESDVTKSKYSQEIHENVMESERKGGAKGNRKVCVCWGGSLVPGLLPMQKSRYEAIGQEQAYNSVE